MQNANAADKAIAITGATGFLGREIVRLLLLIRGKSDADARSRGDAVLASVLEGSALESAKPRVRVVRADLEQDRLGLDPDAYERLAAQTSAVIHGAASVSFTLPLDEARAINVEGTRRMLDLAAKA